ncbi:hypothetical protein RclHR1_03680002 [Rhizophagus clarus]|uniref:Uncharacterized protein n=1 Tax=Rhizophagus clarus TaxID=94130 RepID=A0A2Z6RBR6_9GLOM|nr:hypothetical protein RclHR1_03680002 [Rhizophagus clarus]GES76426.1 hypothetical protein GLOIN_2v1772900 [Rhizophagus clarus]
MNSLLGSILANSAISLATSFLLEAMIHPWMRQLRPQSPMMTTKIMMALGTVTLPAAHSSSTRWYSAGKRFLWYRERSKNSRKNIWIGTKIEFSELSRDWFFIQVDKNGKLKGVHKRYILDEPIAISHKSHGPIDMRKTGTYAARFSSKRLSEEELLDQCWKFKIKKR